MFDNSGPNYPDLLGYVTDGQRMTLDIVEMAMTIPQKIVRAGQPFDVLLFMQNTADVSVVVTVTLHLPKHDLNKQPDRIRTKRNETTILLQPAEVGYLRLPVLAHPNTALGEYQVMLEVDIKPSGKPQIVRKTESGDAISLDYYFYLSESTLERLNSLKQFSFSTAKRGWLSKVIFTSFKLASPSKIDNKMHETNWVSLWSLTEHTDARPLLERHQKTLQKNILTKLNTSMLHDPLLRAVKQRIEEAGYTIQPIEAHYITKLLLTILELGTNPSAQYDYPGEDRYRLATRLTGDLPRDGSPTPLPNWCKSLLYKIDVSPQVVDHPVNTLLGSLFDDLLRDGINLGFELIHDAINTTLGDRQEMEQYASHLLRIFWDPDTRLTFSDVYLPLVLGGVLITERALDQNERPLDSLHNILSALQSHETECPPDDHFIYNLAEKLIHLELRKYGYRMA